MEPSSIVLDGVWVEYAIYGAASRSLKNALLQVASRGRFVGGGSADQSRVVALSGIDLHVRDGDRLGVIGSNGAGKTTLLRVMAGAMKPSRGSVRRVGFTSSLFDVSLGMNSELNGWENIKLRGLYLGLNLAEVRARTDEIAEFSGLTPEQLARPVRTYSSGMQIKLAFAISTSVHPDILLLDEWISAGDADFMEKAHRRMTDMVERSRILVFATHYDWLIRATCNRAICIQEGRLVADGAVEETLALYHNQSHASG